MKYAILFITLILASCNILTNRDNVFDNDKLIGKYKVDLTPAITSAVNADENDDQFDKLGKGLAGMALSSVDMKLTFYENNSGIMELDGGLINLFCLLSDGAVEKINEFTYKVENDSILYMKKKGNTEFSKWAIVRKFSENYDYLQFLIVEEGKENMYYNLSKITE